MRQEQKAKTTRLQDAINRYGLQFNGKKRGKSSSRDWVILLIFLLIAFVLVGRLVYVQIINGEKNRTEGEINRTYTRELTPRRGTIYDRNGAILASSVDAITISADPNLIEDPTDAAKKIASILETDDATIYEALTKENSQYSVIQRKVDIDVANKIKNLDIVGLIFEEDTKRIYPYGRVGGQVIGYVGNDNNGLAGIEYEYEDILNGVTGELIIEEGKRGIPIAGGSASETPSKDGEDIILSIDIELQRYIENLLVDAVNEKGADSGSITLMDSSTGEIYATASYPLIDLSDWQSAEPDASNLKSVMDAYEPGSTFKPIAAAAAIDTNTLTKDSAFDIPPYIEVADYTIKDAVDHGEITYTLSDIIAQSSNIGIVFVIRELGNEKYYEYVKRFGFGSDPGIDYPAATAGILAPVEKWSAINSANIPFGQGVSVSAVQTTRSFCVFANDGIITTPHFLIDIPRSDSKPVWGSERIIKSETAETINGMLEKVITEGSGSLASVDGYTVAGKTATAQYIDETGKYTEDRYNYGFSGFFSQADCDLVCTVIIKDPKTNPSAAPVFADVMSYVAERYKVAPDES